LRFNKIPLFVIIVFGIITLKNNADAGNIIGMIEQMSSPSISRVPNSPFARARSAEEFLPHLDSSDSSLIAVVYLEDHELLIPVSEIIARPVVDQVNMEIIPHILPIQAGTLEDVLILCNMMRFQQQMMAVELRKIGASILTALRWQ